ncbi:olfactory receptor 11A1-like [Acanthochromis polyacanthus]|uniref:olfactory receptor 11A1-like n=1 Tax=Acanthochromis polyacanthus TaxID=80966 RepID=UPI002233F4C8|nr:olfactory receptor 11A1-like [Acanthochromis polyacanthus]
MKMMKNSTQVSDFILAAYFDAGVFKYLFFMIVLCAYVFIVGANGFLIVVICKTRSLHEPMYLFLVSLFVNELFGSSWLFPFLMVQILSDVHTVSASLCFLQVFSLYTYGNAELINLTVMSYDRYLAICYPLQYNTRMTFNKVAFLIAVTWILPVFVIGLTTSLTASLTLCGNIINKVYCNNYSIIQLACCDTTVNNMFEITAASVALCVSGSVILYTYVRILRVCFSGCKQSRKKAFSTCIPHLASLLNFSVGVSFEILGNRFDVSNVPNILQIFLSLHFLTVQPLFNPVMYGLNVSKISIIYY